VPEQDKPVVTEFMSQELGYCVTLFSRDDAAGIPG
jgi:hypothetical protein